MSVGHRNLADASSANCPGSKVGPFAADGVRAGGVGAVVGADDFGWGAGAACFGAGAIVGFGSGAVAADVPFRHVSTYAFSVTPLACIPALSDLHSATQSFKVFSDDELVVWFGAAGAAGLGIVAPAVGTVTPSLH